MNSGQLSQEQVRRLGETAARMSAYLAALSGRMSQKHFPHTDPLRQSAERALAAVRELERALQVLARERP